MRCAPYIAAFSALVLASCDAPADEAPEPQSDVSSAPDTPAGGNEGAEGHVEMPSNNNDTVDDDSQCGADKLGEYVGQSPTEQVKAEIAKKVGDRPIRYYTQGDPITMDYNPARLNVELGEDGRIKLLRCG